MDANEYERLAPQCTVQHAGRELLFHTPNHVTVWRVQTLLTKEPDTIAWIGELGGDDVLFDVGANVGMYSILAAKTRGARVLAFEPESQNYAILNRNIYLNGLDRLVQAYCVAIADRAGFDRLYLSVFRAGDACHSFGAPLDQNNREREVLFAQGCVSATIDELIAGAGMPMPTHIKIDVDGLEHAVIAGAQRTIRDPRLRSVLVEINTGLDEHWDVIDQLLAAGFDYSAEQAEQARRTSGPFEGVGNYVFRR
jgi:FkbM family methyltransferase